MADVVAYLGPAASYTHQAALQLYPTISSSALRPCPTIASVFVAVQSGAVNHGVVPLENSSNGAVLPTLDLFANLDADFPDVHIVGETFVDVHHYLLGHVEAGQQADLSKISSIYSHPQAWGQCRRLLNSHQLSSAAHVDTTSTSAAAAHVAGLRDSPASLTTAAISSRLAAQVYSLDVLAAEIEDNSDNQTRFLLLTRKHKDAATSGTDPASSSPSLAPSTSPAAAVADAPPRASRLGETKTKTLLHFRVPSHTHPGALAEALSVFARHDLNLTSIYTRPDPHPAPATPYLPSASGFGSDGSTTSSIQDDSTLATLPAQRWRYIFFVEFTTAADAERDREVEVALDEVRWCTRDLKVCGRWLAGQ